MMRVLLTRSQMPCNLGYVGLNPVLRSPGLRLDGWIGGMEWEYERTCSELRVSIGKARKTLHKMRDQNADSLNIDSPQVSSRNSQSVPGSRQHDCCTPFQPGFD